MPRGATQQTTVQQRRRPGIPGMLVDMSRQIDRDVLINSDPEAAELYTCVIDTATNSVVYGVNLTAPVAVSVSFTADSSATKIEIAAGLAAAWNTAPQARAIAEAVSDGVDTVTFTGVFAGVPFTMEEDESAALMTLTNTTNATEADAVPFGRAMISLEYQANGYPNPLGIIAKSSALTAQLDTLTPIYSAGERYSVTIEVKGERYQFHVDEDTNIATTCTAIAAAINLTMPAATVIAAGTATTVTLTAELAGLPFKTSAGSEDGDNMTLAHTTTGADTDFNRAFAGISLWSADTQQAAIDTESAEYRPNAGVEVARAADVWVENSQTIVARSDVYVELDGTGSDAGKFFNTDSATRVLVEPSLLKWQRSAFATSDADVAAVRIQLAA